MRKDSISSRGIALVSDNVSYPIFYRDPHIIIHTSYTNLTKELNNRLQDEMKKEFLGNRGIDYKNKSYNIIYSPLEEPVYEENPIKTDFLETYTKKSLEKIKMWINTQIFNLIREANGVASTTVEKNFIKTMLSDQKLDGEKLQLKFIQVQY